ncbi:MAG: nucleotidyltransferase domain-containing protein, partial [Verrucomicrobiota bacterium]
TSELKESAVADKAAVQFPALNNPRYPVHDVASSLVPYLRVIVQRIRPEKIILFGSYAYGEPDEHSDFDLLVVRRGDISEGDSNLQIRKLFWEVPGRRPSFTILTKTSEQISERLKAQSPFYQEIVGRGVELYAA